MKRFLLLSVLIAAIAAPVALACGNEAAMKAGMGHDCPSMMKGVERTVTNTADGVRIEMKSSDPEMVQTLQAHMNAENKPGGCCKDCPMSNAAWSRKVENTRDGVVLTMTASSPDDVSKLQTAAASMTKGGCSHHGAEAGKGGCPKAAHKDDKV
jgi:TusA-related sulfurtransferase